MASPEPSIVSVPQFLMFRLGLAVTPFVKLIIVVQIEVVSLNPHPRNEDGVDVCRKTAVGVVDVVTDVLGTGHYVVAIVRNFVQEAVGQSFFEGNYSGSTTMMLPANQE